MIAWRLIDTATMPGGGGDLRLMQRGAEFSIMLGRIELMNSRLSGSEQALAKLSCPRIKDRARPQILIGGLGMGFTLRAALAELGPQAKVVVAELVPAVVAWARGPMAEVFGTCLADPRVTVCEEDVGSLIRSGAASYVDSVSRSWPRRNSPASRSKRSKASHRTVELSWSLTCVDAPSTCCRSFF